jgi:nitrate reductase NapD
MNISSVVLRALPSKLDIVRQALATLPGVEIHHDGGNGRFVLTLEDVDDITPERTFTQLQTMEGVLNASLVYQYCDEKESD